MDQSSMEAQVGRDAWSDNEPTLPGPPPVGAAFDAENTIPGHTLGTSGHGSASRKRPRLVHARPAPDHVHALKQMRACLAKKDHEGALAFAEMVLAKHPQDLQAKEGRLRSELSLEDAYLKQLGTLESVPQLAFSLGEMRALLLDHRTAFLLTRVDGVSSLQAILNISGMSNVDALRAFSGLVRSGIVVMAL